MLGDKQRSEGEVQSRPTWRLLNSGYQKASDNMALDEAILAAYSRGEVPPTLRFYGWQPEAVSLGYFQRAAKEIDLAACKAAGIDVVRRLTGGRAVLHAEELTYSIIVGENYPQMPQTITASYRYLSKGLLLGLAKLGLDAEMTKPQSAYAARTEHLVSAACFDSPSHYELTLGRRKLIGSAQVRKKGVILQHGSILLEFSPKKLTGILNLTDEAKIKTEVMLRERVIDLRTALGRSVSWEEVRKSMTEGFVEALALNLEPGVLTTKEKAEASVLARAKYDSAAWTLKR